MKRILIVLTVLSGTAAAQPGVTPPSEPPPGTQPGPPPGTPPVPPPGTQVEAQGQAGASINVDELIERVQAASPTIETVARGTLRRARRAIAFGPTAGFWGGGV